jgi:hypothetical protein
MMGKPHSKSSSFSQVYKPACLNIGVQTLPPEGFAEGYFRNRCILSAGAEYLTINGARTEQSSSPVCCLTFLWE